VTVVEDKLNLEFRVFGKKHRQVRNDMEPSKANRCRDRLLNKVSNALSTSSLFFDSVD
jgi:hypothetical protein